MTTENILLGVSMRVHPQRFTWAWKTHMNMSNTIPTVWGLNWIKGKKLAEHQHSFPRPSWMWMQHTQGPLTLLLGLPCHDGTTSQNEPVLTKHLCQAFWHSSNNSNYSSILIYLQETSEQNCASSSKHVCWSPNSQYLSVFGNRIFRNAIKVKWGQRAEP